MAKKLTILFNALEAEGHVNSCIGLAEKLRNRGHKIVFVTDQSFKQKLETYGFVPELTTSIKDDDAVEYWADMLLENKIISGLSSLEKQKVTISNDLFLDMLDNAKQNESFLKECVAKHNPDIILIDGLLFSPALIYSGKPWIWVCSLNPLHAFRDTRLPPPFSGYPVNGNPDDWIEFRGLVDFYYGRILNDYNKWMTGNGYPAIKTSTERGFPESPYLNLYDYPEELDYTDVITVPENYLRLDTFMRSVNGKFKIPKELENRGGKLIYLSMGSMGSVDVELMKKLISILSKSPHRFIVSKGIFHHKYELAANMYGDRYLPQTLILPQVDLVITHGGNNTVTETFYFGKPMIVMPLFADQYDNAQRIHEKGYGIRLDPYDLTENDLLTTIENVLNDNALRVKCENLSKRIQTSKSVENAVRCIENLVKN